MVCYRLYVKLHYLQTTKTYLSITEKNISLPKLDKGVEDTTYFVPLFGNQFVNLSMPKV